MSEYAAPWDATLSVEQHSVISYFLLLGVLAFFAGLVRTWLTSSEVSTRYRTATVARFSVMGVALLTYLFLMISFQSGYDRVGDSFVPNLDAINSFAPRYVEWSVSVPLLTVELLAVCTLVGAELRKTRLIAMASSFAMIFTGYLGAVAFGSGESRTDSIVWGLISCVFWIIATAVLIRAVRASYGSLTSEGATILRNATVILLGGWFIYPAVYLLQVIGFGGEWTTAIQVTLTVADILVKLAFGGLIHRIAKLRTAEDVRKGLDVHPEAIWISSVKQSDAGLPREVYLADHAVVHRRREKPPEASAVAAAPEDLLPDLDD